MDIREINGLSTEETKKKLTNLYEINGGITYEQQ